MNDRRQFLIERAAGIGGSDAAAVLGVHPYRTRLALYHEKRRWIEDPEGAADAALNGDEDVELHWWGKRMEPLIAERYEMETGRRVIRHLNQEFVVHPDKPYIHGHIDFDVIDDARGIGVLETKNAGIYRAADWKDEPPLYARIQAAHYQALGSTGWCSVAACVGGNRLVYADFDRDDVFVSNLHEAIDLFWNGHVLAGVAPPADGRDLALLQGLWKPNGERIELPEAALQLDDNWVEARRSLKYSREDADDAEAAIKEMMGSAEVGLLPGGRGRYEWKAGSDGVRRFRRVKRGRFQ